MAMLPLLLVLSALAGAAAFAGALLGWASEHHQRLISDRLQRAIVAFGGGALIGAVGLVLVPHGLENQPLWLGTLSFLTGGLAFLFIDRTLQKRGTPVSQLIALNLDFVPEAMVLGAVISSDLPMALFLTAIMSAQNLPEGFNAYGEVRKAHKSFIRKHILGLMALCVIAGPLAAFAGYGLFSMDSGALGVITTFCAGGILYLVFEDVAPEAKKKGDWYPAFGAVLGFTVALIGHGLTA